MPDLFTSPQGLPQIDGTYYEVESVNSGPRRTWQEHNHRIRARVRVRWQDSFVFPEKVVGTVVRDGTGGTGNVFLRRGTPHLCPEPPVRPIYGMQCEGVDQGGNPTSAVDGPTYDSNGWPVPKWKRFDLTWEGPAYRLALDDVTNNLELHRYVSRSRVSRPREVGVLGGAWIIDGTNTRIMQSQFTVCPFADVRYVWHRIPFTAIPRNACRNCEGKINAAPFDTDTSVRGHNYATETMLFKGYDDSDQFWDATGVYCVNLVYTFEYHPFTWNKFPNAVNRWVLVHAEGTTAQRPYETADFNTLFKPE